MPKNKVKEETNATINEEVLGLLKTVVERLEKVENTIAKPITSQISAIMDAPETPVSEPQPVPSLPVPQDYRKLVDSVLNKSFGLELEPHVDAPVVTATVVVPDKYSTMTPAQREMMKRDIRPKVMTTAGGVSELREWVETVYRSFTPELQSMIVMDRTL